MLSFRNRVHRRMMLRDMTAPYSGSIQKSRSCPADFMTDEVDRAISPSRPTTPPVSIGQNRRKKPSSDGKKDSTNNNGRITLTMPMGNGNGYGPTPDRALPGRPRRRRNRNPAFSMPKRKKNSSQSLPYRILNAPWMNNPVPPSNSFTSLGVAILLWYTLGVISITSSNLLMMEPVDHVGGVPPLLLTLQQLIIGVTMLQFLLRIRFLGSPGIQPWPNSFAAAQAVESRRKTLLFNSNMNSNKNSQISDLVSSNLVMTGLCFAMGFLATNSGFLASSAAFVETVKAAEPITSAMVAVLWRIEALTQPEVFSLGSIVTGVLISTLAHSASQSSNADSVGASILQSIQSCAIVMAANLCFSFRGLYQKLFRASPEGSVGVIDDLNLQFRMQQIGVLLLAIPVFVFDVPGISSYLWKLSSEVGLIRSGVLFRYLGLALINGMAFASYNLASTYILTRITVVHHAALNCIRRIFAIIMASLYFRTPITVMGIIGFFVSFGGFMAFTHYKILRQKQPKPLSSLLPVSAVGTGK